MQDRKPSEDGTSIEFLNVMSTLHLDCQSGMSMQYGYEKNALGRVRKLSNSCALQALEAANNFTSKYPYFKVAIISAEGPLYIPSSFANKHIKPRTQIVTLCVAKRSWPGNLLQPKKREYLLPRQN